MENEIKLFEMLKANIGKKEAEAFVELLEIKKLTIFDLRSSTNTSKIKNR